MHLFTGEQEEVQPVFADMLKEPRQDKKLLKDNPDQMVSPIPFHH